MSIRVENHGSIVLLRPMNDEAREWLTNNVQEYRWGLAFVVEPRYVGPILEGFSEAGGEIL